MIDAMIELLAKEQKSDDAKKSYCEKNIDETEDEFKDLQNDIQDSEKSIADGKEGIKAVAAELASLTQSIKDMDTQVADLTKQRKAEHAEFEKDFASNAAAKELLSIAKNRLAKFYSPKLYKPPAQRTLSESEQITVNMGGTLAPTAPPGGVAGTGVTAAFAQYEADAAEDSLDEQVTSMGFLQVRSKSRIRAAPPPPPETAGAYQKSQDASQGVTQMLDTLMSELAKEMQTMETNEKEAQREYEEFVNDSADKRATTARSISDKEGNKVELEATTLKTVQDKKGMMVESVAKMETLQNLHGECDWLGENYDSRKKARAGEVENLNSAKSVLSGADYSL
jgi:septal ring factor EnvC (AmiA/AmiB activator)